MSQKKSNTKKTATPKKPKAALADSSESVDFDDNNEPEQVTLSKQDLAAAVVFYTDWTAEVLVTQTSNISLTPNFQRRDAWSIEKKARFIESLILGLPVPPIILAEQKGAKGRFIVLDGKQRLLSLFQFWGVNEGSPNNSFPLKKLDVRTDLEGIDYATLSQDDEHSEDVSALRNQTIRTVVIRNWPNDEFLHLVFLRLNTGSVKLSAQELRQALKPGEFTSRLDSYAADSALLHRLLGRDGPDPRMRDSEILGRHIAFVNFIGRYPGRLKTFVDEAFDSLNKQWLKKADEVNQQFARFDSALESLFDIFGDGDLARRLGSRRLNKALLDPLLFYFEREDVRSATKKNSKQFKREYQKLLSDTKLEEAISLDTASPTSTIYRFKKIADILNKIYSLDVPIPKPSSSGPGTISLD